jgi:HK97 family phage major capsid protein
MEHDVSKHVSTRALLAGAIELKGDEEDPVAIVTKSLEELTKTVDDRLKAVETKSVDPAITKRLDDIEKKMNRPKGDDDVEKKAAAEGEKKAWLTYLRKGVQTDDVTLKALTVADDTQAGYLAPTEVSAEVIRDITQISPIRQYATVRTSSAPAIRYPKRTSITNAKWEGEIEQSEESDVTFGQVEIGSKRLTTFVDISNSLLMGSNGTAEAEVRQAFAEDFAQKENLAFLLGDGVKQPEGILVNGDVPYFPGTTTLNTDSLISFMYSLAAPYRSRGVWLMNGTTLASIRKLKDGQNNYIWQPSLQAGQPETLLGRPVAEAIDMPDIANNAFPVLFGDLGTAYRIVDRQQLATLTDPYTQARNAITRIHATEWVGGGVVQPKAIKKLKMSAS